MIGEDRGSIRKEYKHVEETRTTQATLDAKSMCRAGGGRSPRRSGSCNHEIGQKNTKTKTPAATTFKPRTSAAPATTVAPVVSAAPVSSVAPTPSTAPAAPPTAAGNAKFFETAASTASDLGSTYQLYSSPLMPDDLARGKIATARVAACNGFPDTVPFYTAKAKEAQGWTYFTNGFGSPSAVHVVVLFADDATAHNVLESVRNFPDTPACQTGFGVQQILLETGTIVTISNARFGPPLPALGDDQMSILSDMSRIVDGVAQPVRPTQFRAARFGPALLIYRDEASAVDRIAPILAAKLQAALKA